MAAIKALKSKCVILAIEGKNDIYPTAFGGFVSPKAGKTYPYAVITSPDQTVLYEVLSNRDLYSRKALTAAKESSIEKLKTNPSGYPKADEPLAFGILAKPGYRDELYIGEIISKNSFMATRKKGGKMKKVSTNKYTPGAKAYIKQLFSMKAAKEQAELDAKIKELMPELEVETWTNTEGKPLKGTFVSLVAGQITLKLPKKNTPVTFSIDLLDEASQERANEIDAQIAEVKKKIEEMKKEAK